MTQEVHLTNGTVIALAGSLISFLSAMVIGLIVYSFRTTVEALRKAITDLAEKVGEIGGLDTRLTRLETEHDLLSKCKWHGQREEEG